MTDVKLAADLVLVKLNGILIVNSIYSYELIELALERVNNTNDKDCIITIQRLNRYYEALALTR